uniref:Protein FAM170A n=1 Tax=Sus scrofa TaxID=9823 RepID=A0A5G2QNR9_PIG
MHQKACISEAQNASSCCCTVFSSGCTMGVSKLHEYDLPSGYSWEYNALVPEARSGASESEYFSCDSSFSNPSCAEFWKTPEDTSQPESYVEVPVCSQTPGEKSSDSEYFSCVSSPCKLIFADEDGIHPMHQDDSYLRSPEKPLPQDLEQWETSSPFPQVSFPFNLVNSNESFVSSIFMKKKRVMKIYYMHVQMKKGVAILWETEKGLEPPSKKIKIEEMTYPEKIHMAFTLPHMSTKEFLTDSEFSWDSKVQEEREETDSPAEPTVLEECSRAKTPEWLVALDSGFRCMGCCRVFPSLDILQEHVEHGVKEGFSCHAFHLALAWLKSKGSKKGKKKRRKKTKIKKTTSGHQNEKHFGMKTSSCK